MLAAPVAHAHWWVVYWVIHKGLLMIGSPQRVDHSRTRYRPWGWQGVSGAAAGGLPCLLLLAHHPPGGVVQVCLRLKGPPPCLAQPHLCLCP